MNGDSPRQKTRNLTPRIQTFLASGHRTTSTRYPASHFQSAVPNYSSTGIQSPRSLYATSPDGGPSPLDYTNGMFGGGRVFDQPQSPSSYWPGSPISNPDHGFYGYSSPTSPQTYIPTSMVTDIPYGNHLYPQPDAGLLSHSTYIIVPQVRYKRPGKQGSYFEEHIVFSMGFSDAPFVTNLLEKPVRFKLDNADHVVFSEVGQCVSIRINWPGYEDWSKQIATKDFKRDRNYISLQVAAIAICRKIAEFFEENQNKPARRDSSGVHPEWEIGPGKITLDRVRLHSITRVSQGSWQPTLSVYAV